MKILQLHKLASDRDSEETGRQEQSSHITLLQARVVCSGWFVL